MANETKQATQDDNQETAGTTFSTTLWVDEAQWVGQLDMGLSCHLAFSGRHC